MKTSFFLIAVFFVTCLLSTVIGAFVYMIYMNCSLLVAGRSLVLFEAFYFYKGLSIMLPIMSVVSCLFVIFYLIRHRAHVFISTLVYFILCVVVWIVIIPVSFGQQAWLSSVVTEPERSFLSPGFFRPVNNGIYYFSSVDQDGVGDGIYIDSANLYGRENGVQTVHRMPTDKISSNGFIDPLIYNAVALSPFLRIFFETISTIQLLAEKAHSDGLLAWLGFATFGLALSSLIGLKRLSQWRLLNVFYIILFFMLICYLNVLMYTSSVFIQFRHLFIPKIATPIPLQSYGGFLGWAGFVPLVVNASISILFLLFGCIKALRVDPNREDAQ